MNKNPPPPFIPVIYGNLHILPKPTAEPNVAKKTASPDENVSLFLFSIIIPL
jgi:hypothetical protein